MGATFGLGVLIFIDDYFNCLTVGSVMRPVTDTHNISRAKLAYIIDATAAPICMIAPISSWAAAVTGVVEGYNGLELFIKAIPYNFYSLLTIVMMIFIIFKDLDYGPMRKYERNAVLHNDIFTDSKTPYEDEIKEPTSSKGRVIDLVLPIIILIIFSIIGMIYTGGFFSGETFIDSFANSDASLGLAMGSLVSLLLTFVWIVARRVLSFNEFMECIVKGFNAMVPAILILTFAWTLSSMTGALGAAPYVAGIVEGSAGGLQALLPAIIFLVATFLAFATGTSWGTFGILIPIIVGLGAALSPDMLIIGISACLAGAVCGDHCSPISDTTIMASTGAQVQHIVHVSTQLPYALTVAAVSFVTYIVAGFTESIIALPIGIVLMVGTLMVIQKTTGRKGFSEIHEEKVQDTN
jgi:Na+/H+ antiporter NhaC